MSRGTNNGWDFVKVGEVYQYKEDWFIAMVTILEDNSTTEAYDFKVRVEQSNIVPYMYEFHVGLNKSMNGVYSGMPQIYETPEYSCNYTYVRPV